MSNDTQVASKTQLIIHTIVGVQVPMRVDDGYLNIGALASAYYKATGTRRDPHDWVNNKRTKESIQHLSTITGIPVVELIQRVMGGNVPEKRGTWIHPRLAVRFAIWLSDEFGYQVESIVDDWRKVGVETKPSFEPFPDDPELGDWLSTKEPLLPRLGKMADMLIEDKYFRLLDVPRADSRGIAIFFQLQRSFLEEQIGKMVGDEIYEDDRCFVDRQGFVRLSFCFLYPTKSGDSRYIKRDIFLLAFDRLENQVKPVDGRGAVYVDYRARFKKVAQKLLSLRPEWEQVIRCRYAGLTADDICKLLGIKSYRLNGLVREMKDVGLLPERFPVKRDGGELVLEGLA